jgi:hypothetical protein
MRYLSILLLSLILILVIAMGADITIKTWNAGHRFGAFVFLAMWAAIVVEPIRFALANELHYSR